MRASEQIKLLEAQITRIDKLDKAEDHEAYKAWHMQTELLLKKVFDKDAEEVHEFHRLDGQASVFVARRPDINNQRATDAYFRHLKEARSSLTGIVEFLKATSDEEPETMPVSAGSLDALHDKVKDKCSSLYLGKHYSDAVDKGFRVVRDRLRELTKYETGSEAFGKGGLHINGATNEYVEKDFQDAVKFLTMAIDQFRNEKVHTSDGNIQDPVRAYEYLALSSLAMHLLDDAEVRKKPDETKSPKPSKSTSKPATGEREVSLDSLQVLAMKLFANMSGQKELIISRTSGGDTIHPLGELSDPELLAELNSIDDMQEFEVNLDEMESWSLVTVEYGKYNSKRYKLAKKGYSILKEHPELKKADNS